MLTSHTFDYQIVRDPELLKKTLVYYVFIKMEYKCAIFKECVYLFWPRSPPKLTLKGL